MGKSADKRLLQASKEGDVEAVQNALNDGADVNTTHYETPRMSTGGMAPRRNGDHLRRRSLFLENGDTPLTVACRNGHDNVVSVLLENGAEVNKERFYDGRTALHEASTKAVASLLLANGADIHANACRGGETPLHRACDYGCEGIAAVLIENGANIDAQRNDGSTALHVASSNGHEGIVELLLKHGANVDIQANDESTALQIACEKGHGNVVRKLIEKGASM